MDAYLWGLLPDNDRILDRWGRRFQVSARDWAATVAAYRLQADAFDLQAPNRRLTAFCREKGIVCVDPTEGMREFCHQTGKDLYLLRGDMHWNRDGHRAFAAAIAGPVRAALGTVP